MLWGGLLVEHREYIRCFLSYTDKNERRNREEGRGKQDFRQAPPVILTQKSGRNTRVFAVLFLFLHLKQRYAYLVSGNVGTFHSL